jgi:hypothetical protein
MKSTRPLVEATEEEFSAGLLQDKNSRVKIEIIAIRGILILFSIYKR